ncbi:hypothetical protein MMMB2_2392 [Mycobacterium marinum MB2]|nr:hypothetical protein MMMB2_2392 [Mycobacterium marinum MB2]
MVISSAETISARSRLAGAGCRRGGSSHPQRQLGAAQRWPSARPGSRTYARLSKFIAGLSWLISGRVAIPLT